MKFDIATWANFLSVCQQSSVSNDNGGGNGRQQKQRKEKKNPKSLSQPIYICIGKAVAASWLIINDVSAETQFDHSTLFDWPTLNDDINTFISSLFNKIPIAPQVYGKSPANYCSLAWIMLVKPHYCICSKMISLRSTFPHCIQVSDEL